MTTDFHHPAPRVTLREHRAALIEQNRRLVPFHVHQLRRGATADEFEDLIGAGNIGLVLAADRFDPLRGRAFGTFAGFYIRGAVLRHLKAARASLSTNCLSLDAPVPGQEAGTLADTLEDETVNVERSVTNEAAVVALWERVTGSGILDARQAVVIDRHYRHGEALSDIAVRLGMTKQGASGVHKRAIQRLRHSFGVSAETFARQ